jgi:glyoxylase-like metal-dependent hydrolase (beta-lactamase superfamily II)
MTLEGTNTYVVGESPAYVIDPGPDDPAHIEAVRTAAAERGGIAGVLLTHSHSDHSAGAARLGGPILWGVVNAGDEFAPASESGQQTHGRPVERVGPFEVIPTPGHAADHASFLLGAVCFCGDLILGTGSSIVGSAAFGGSLADYMASLERVARLELELLAPGHGPWITDPAAKIAEYVEHREERERRLIAALEDGERSRRRLVEIVWDDVPDELRWAAAVAMEAHLEKLDAEGRLPESITD